MRYRLIFLAIAFLSFKTEGRQLVGQERPIFNAENDLLLVHFDCKTDVDDLHSLAALATLLSDSAYSGISYYTVAGTYGIQEGLYVPPNDLFKIAMKGHWTDADKNFVSAIKKVRRIAGNTLREGGDIWIAEAGQSDFSAALIRSIRKKWPQLDVSHRVHLVQHSSWNEEVTSPQALTYVQQHIEYHKIPDGNAVGNGSPGFRIPSYTDWKTKITDTRLLEIWQMAVDLGNQYNGKEGRYNNEAVASGGLDFSDLSEVCWILGLEEIRDTQGFFERFGH